VQPVLASAGGPQDVVLVAAALAAAAALVLTEPRQRAASMLAALVLAAGGVALLHPHAGGHRAALLVAAAVAGLVVIVILAAVVHRRPEAFAVLTFAALPFRIPVSFGGDSANLLVPLYAVIAAGALAYAWRAFRAPEAGRPEEPEPLLRRLQIVLAAVLVLYAIQALYSTDLEQAVKNTCFFYVPFALLFPLLVPLQWSRRLLIVCLAVIAGLAIVFAGVAFVEFATNRLLIPNSKVQIANDLKPYFRVNSLFFDPNIYGRYLALTMTVLTPLLLWTRRGRHVAPLAVVLAILWAGLVISLSQSSFLALLVGLAVLAALRWRLGPVLLAVLVAAAAGAAVVIATPGTIGLDTSVNQASAGRADLIRGGARMFRDRPAEGFGSGSFQERYRARQHVTSRRVAAISHTIPVTVAAEQGVPGILAYLALLWCAFRLLLAGLRRELHAGWPDATLLGRAAAAAAFTGLFVHTLLYAAFLEDPLTWALIALAAGLRRTPREPHPEPVSPSRPA
jgi:putative inorganic carbon (HCO3(-)) transporter